jgi:hypothetical protein
MPSGTQRSVVAVLRSTLEKLEKTRPADDPAVRDLKTSLLKTIAEMEVKKTNLSE